jgi:hypothetical protein
MVCESKIMYGIEVWGLKEAWKGVIRFIADFAVN